MAAYPSFIILVDANNLFLRMFHALEGSHNGGVQGFFNSLEKISERFGGILVLVWDECKNPERVKFCRNYKANRSVRRKEMDEETRADLQYQRKVCAELARYLSIPQVALGEADDVIGWFSDPKNLLARRFLIVSTDKDFLQLVSGHVSVFNPQKQRVITERNFKEQTGITDPIAFLNYLCLLGDKVDDIPGVDGFGEKRAKTIVNTWGSAARFATSSDPLPLRFPKDAKQRIIAASKRLRLNRQLIQLRLLPCVVPSLEEIRSWVTAQKPCLKRFKEEARCREIEGFEFDSWGFPFVTNHWRMRLWGKAGIPLRPGKRTGTVVNGAIALHLEGRSMRSIQDHFERVHGFTHRDAERQIKVNVIPFIRANS